MVVILASTNFLEVLENTMLWSLEKVLLWELCSHPRLLKSSTSFQTERITSFEVKFMTVLGFLIAIRVGTPRYRYDFLSKLGWLKLLSLSLASFTVVILWLIA